MKTLREKVTRYILLSVIIGASWHLSAEEGIEAPAGYFIQPLAEIHGHVLVPEGWYFFKQVSENPDHFAYRITKEDLEKAGYFYTGMTINVYLNVEQYYQINATEYAQQLVTAFGQTGDPQLINFEDTQKSGSYEITALELIKEIIIQGQPCDIRLVFTAIANDKTGNVYAVLYGAPSEQWWEERKYLQVMRRLSIDEDKPDK